MDRATEIPKRFRGGKPTCVSGRPIGNSYTILWVPIVTEMNTNKYVFPDFPPKKMCAEFRPLDFCINDHKCFDLEKFVVIGSRPIQRPIITEE